MSAPVAPPTAPGSSRPPARVRRPPGRHRRRRQGALLALGALAALALVVGAGVGSRPDAPREPAETGAAPARAERAVDRLSLEQQVGQTLVLSFDATEAPDYVLELLRERRVAGVVLFRENVASRSQLRELTSDLQRAARGRAFVAVDQEGGSIRQVPWAEPVDGQSGLTDEDEVSSAAAAGAADLRAAGINLNLAPILDVGAPGGSAVGGRAYPGEAAEVAALGRASVGAHLREGVLPAPKHFPGFGAAQANTDDQPVTIDSARAKLLGSDLEPFRAAVDEGTPLVMASHALYPALDGKRIASQSPAILDGLLRRRLGFRGVVVTDSLEADAVLSRSSVATAGVRSLAGGADLLLMTGAGSYRPVFDRVLARARRSPAFRRRVEESAARVLDLGDRVRRLPTAAQPSAR